MDLKSQLKHANRAIHNAQEVRTASEKLLAKKSKKPIQPSQLKELAKIMHDIEVATDKTMKGAKLAESRAHSRLLAVKKATSKAIMYTKKAKYAALASKKAANSALITSRKMKTPQLAKKYQKTYRIQINASVRAAKTAKDATEKAVKSSETARIAARMPLKELHF